MKNFLLILAFSVIMGSAYSQKVAVGGKIGVGVQAGNTNITIPIVATAEYAIDENKSVSADIGYEIGPGAKNRGMVYFSPEFRYHFSEVFKGAYVGGYFGVGGYQFNSNYISLGATGGYQVMITDNFNLDANIQVGWGSIGFKGGGSRLNVGHIRPTVGLRYAF